ncbi:LysE family translocator [Microbulbifer taiwanensis]|uniref:LysE family translocator n=1 Tax=Microbulbifer taiwanensis TaxID=986746 RepID=A0ABW1YR60_9GAMM|nr:LysE family translocator [Microbulbifer taiwanensis]
MLQQFLLVAGAHFLALLSPGPDFFLILRYAIAQGRARAALVCAGVTLANALFIGLAWFGLMALDGLTGLFAVLQWAGCGFLLYMGWLFIRHAGNRQLVTGGDTGPAPGQPLGAFGAGLASGLLNPKNGLFYASLFAVLNSQGTPESVQGLYALWMVGVVLGWDLLVVWLASQQALMRRFGNKLAHIERLAGVLLVLLAFGVIASQLPH